MALWSVQSDTPLFMMVSISPCLPHPSHTTETVWNPKSLSFSGENERLPWNGPLTKTLQQWKQPREQPESPENHRHIKLCSATGAFLWGSWVRATNRMRHEPKYADEFLFFSPLFLVFDSIDVYLFLFYIFSNTLDKKKTILKYEIKININMNI